MPDTWRYPPDDQPALALCATCASRMKHPYTRRDWAYTRAEDTNQVCSACGEEGQPLAIFGGFLDKQVFIDLAFTDFVPNSAMQYGTVHGVVVFEELMLRRKPVPK